MRNAKLLIFNTIILTLSGFIMRTVSVSFNIYLTKEIGTAGIGLFQLIMTVYGLVITFASAGIKLGATRLVTHTVITQKQYVRSTMSTCIEYALCVSITVAFLLFLFSGLISEKWIGDTRAKGALKILALSLPPISVSAAISGYFTARKNMLKFSIIQLVEQSVRILITISALKTFGNTGINSACCAIAGGITVSESTSAFLSYLVYQSENKTKFANNDRYPVIRKLIHICVPDAAGSGFRSILLTIEHLLIPRGFKNAGNSAEESMSIYGTIHAIALPIVLYPSAVLSSLSSLLIPEISRYKLLNDKTKISFTVTNSIKITIMFSFAIATFMYFFADEICYAVYDNSKSAFYIRLLSVLVPVMYTDMITDGLLKGLDEQKSSMRYNIFDSALCVVLVYILLPRYSIGGYIFVIFLSEVINFALSVSRLVKVAELRINLITDILKPLLCSFSSCFIVRQIIVYTNICKISNVSSLLLSALIVCILIAISTYFIGCFSKSDINTYIKMIKNKSYA